MSTHATSATMGIVSAAQTSAMASLAAGINAVRPACAPMVTGNPDGRADFTNELTWTVDGWSVIYCFHHEVALLVAWYAPEGRAFRLDRDGRRQHGHEDDNQPDYRDGWPAEAFVAMEVN